MACKISTQGTKPNRAACLNEVELRQLTVMDDDTCGRRSMLGLVLMAALLIAGGLGLMMWDDHREREPARAVTSAVP